MASPTFSFSGSSLSWSWAPTRRRSSARSRRGSRPSTRTVPPSGGGRPPIGSTVGGAQALDDLPHGGLAGPVGTEDAEDLAPLHGEGQIVDRDLVAVLLV